MKSRQDGRVAKLNSSQVSDDACSSRVWTCSTGKRWEFIQEAQVTVQSSVLDESSWKNTIKEATAPRQVQRGDRKTCPPECRVRWNQWNWSTRKNPRIAVMEFGFAERRERWQNPWNKLVFAQAFTLFVAVYCILKVIFWSVRLKVRILPNVGLLGHKLSLRNSRHSVFKNAWAISCHARLPRKEVLCISKIWLWLLYLLINVLKWPRK